ncbi:maleylpyruvate isomerase family mycothiol-dependent enzyme [Amycolatopsis balhimycina DSM 5908]|uniref:Maleylpyruvate isomerase family mycothiol-dependent enzyme n=1 Tax=Amycolatopsis balhimycina DSM 5908 TaxID=1081091 RepID=A0A428VYG9_AMYBA|nr:maleylpyruvate isomerase family mycothiol-dependent enzyme [Amycolatopsis balhimycina]RSM35842.1 maleylpyruvate isomerase family mycothiol-dependent enzyme [Amycolatopsis balhimycina DSM 5908]
MDNARLAEGLHEHTAGFAYAATQADPDTLVPTCPEWPLRVLTGHIGQAHRWAAGIVRSGPSPVPDPFDADPGSPEKWSDWLLQGAAELEEAVRASGETPVWTFFGPQPARFWLRRMLHDTTVHHADAALATGTAFTVAPDHAADAISEWLELLANPVTASLRPGFAELRGTGQTLRLAPDDGPGWLVHRTPGGVRWTRDGEPADVTLAGPVEDLLLVLTRRLPADRVTVTGDHALAEHWLAHTAA